MILPRGVIEQMKPKIKSERRWALIRRDGKIVNVFDVDYEKFRANEYTNQDYLVMRVLVSAPPKRRKRHAKQ